MNREKTEVWRAVVARKGGKREGEHQGARAQRDTGSGFSWADVHMVPHGEVDSE